MGKGTLFFCCASCILVLTIINLSIGPIVSGALKNIMNEDLGTLNCEKKKDELDDAKDQPGVNDDVIKYYYEYSYNACQRKKGMHDMEYTAFIFDIVIGLICGLLGLLHIFEVKKDFVSNTGLIGIICGVIGFVLTFVYVIFNGLVYTTVYAGTIDISTGSASIHGVLKRDEDYAIAEKDGDTFKCLYFDNQFNFFSAFAKFSDLGKKQYNYDKDIIKDYTTDQIRNCIEDNSVGSSYIVRKCARKEQLISGTDISNNYKTNNCEMIYIRQSLLESGIENKDLSDRFLTTLILSLVVCLANIGLALFGFLLFRTPGEF